MDGFGSNLGADIHQGWAQLFGGKRRWRPPSNVWDARELGFHYFGLCARTEGPIVAGRTSFDSDRRRQDRLVNCRGVMGSNPDKAVKIKKIYYFGTRQCDMQRRPLNQYRRAKMLHYLSIEDFCSKMSSGGLLEKVVGQVFVCMYACMSVRLSKHFRLWSPNGWADRDGRIFVRCAGTAEIRW